MTHRFASVIILLVLGSFATAAAAASPFVNIPVAGTLKNDAGLTPLTFQGTVDVTGFTFFGTQVDASGTLTGVIKDSSGTVITTVGPNRIGLGAVTFLIHSCQPSQAELQLGLPAFPFGIDIASAFYHGPLTTAGSAGIVVPPITASSSEVELKDALCRIVDLVGNGGPAPAIANQLNRLIRLLA